MSILEKLRKEQENRVSEFRKMIGTYAENGYTFLHANQPTGAAVFYHHAKNKFQDDVVFVEAKVDYEDWSVSDRRILISRESFLKMAEDLK